jgi:hypothetical protein
MFENYLNFLSEFVNLVYTDTTAYTFFIIVIVLANLYLLFSVVTSLIRTESFPWPLSQVKVKRWQIATLLAMLFFLGLTLVRYF